MENTTERDDHCVFHEAAITFLATEELDPVAKLISSLLRPPENQDAEAKISRNTFYRFCSTNFPNSMSLKLLQIYASPDKTGYDDNIRQIAIRHLNVLVSNHRGKGEEPLLPFLALKGLARLLITCLVEQEIYEDTFKILAQVAYHIAFEISLRQSIFWPDLLKFISSNAEKEFHLAVTTISCFLSWILFPRRSCSGYNPLS
ncbi:PREDICTED: uncharacterized protein LOC109116331 [Tarenaya hassleriana]|uniref:uncharacterized protein LOC109116331 n=1 Tax=Tarenaya hassleriana TaxID=28532 RepID=UPI0008FD5F34|nr:PREDICTED: uncharacterized protein LOC109116331 [Tarenaya hassleriana]